MVIHSHPYIPSPQLSAQRNATQHIGTWVKKKKKEKEKEKQGYRAGRVLDSNFKVGLS